MLPWGNPPPAVIAADGGGSGDGAAAAASVRSLLTGLVLVWSTPTVLRIEGLSRCGLKRGALMDGLGPAWRDSAARAVKKPTGGPWPCR